MGTETLENVQLYGHYDSMRESGATREYMILLDTYCSRVKRQLLMETHKICCLVEGEKQWGYRVESSDAPLDVGVRKYAVSSKYYYNYLGILITAEEYERIT